MKMLLMIILTLLSMNAFSVTGKDKWKTIRSDRDVLIQQPTFAAIFGPQGLFNACATEYEFKSKTPVKHCLSYREVQGAYKDYTCAEYENRNIVIARTYIQNECVRYAPMSRDSSGECLEYEDITSVYPTSFQLAVIEAENNEHGNFIFSKNYTVPACE